MSTFRINKDGIFIDESKARFKKRLEDSGVLDFVSSVMTDLMDDMSIDVERKETRPVEYFKRALDNISGAERAGLEREVIELREKVKKKDAVIATMATERELTEQMIKDLKAQLDNKICVDCRRNGKVCSTARIIRSADCRKSQAFVKYSSK